MSNWFDRFTDLDKMKEQAEGLWDRGVRETKRQAALAKIRIRLISLEQRMKAALLTLGKQVWDLHCADTLTKDNLGNAFDALESLADEIAEAKADLEQVQKATTEAEIAEAVADDTPIDEAPAGDDEPERNLE
ncbi:MAG: hypothetical protein HZB16_02720 [Armatimonadetes bacterium]|nr:hypothetical protein [Armatimonadota bacterium]